MNKFAQLITCALLLTLAANASARSAKLDAWVTQDLVPYVSEQLTTQPRFRNESVRFVVLNDENPQPASNELALSIRDRLRDSVAQEPGLRVVWQRDIGQRSATGSVDCTSDQVHYFIGVDVVEERNGEISVQVRALDTEDHSWVAGFSKSWRGRPNATQQRQLHQSQADNTFRGARNAPFDESQFDLLAAQIAHDLGCAVLRQTAGEYVVDTMLQRTAEQAEAAMLELVRNNLADFRAVQFSQGGANAMIEGKAHWIDDELYQYWVTITPSDVGSDLPAISASAYIRIADKYAVAKLIPSVSLPVAKSDIAFLTGLKIVELRDTRSCATNNSSLGSSRVFNSRYSSSAIDCYALEVGASSDSVVFFLNHQLNSGLVRLSGQSCDYRTDAKIARVSERVHFPLPGESLLSASWIAADGWQLNPDQDTYYVVAATDTKAARALSQHIARLPNRCSASVRSGLEGRELQRWVDQLASIATHWKSSVDWQVIRVKNIY